MKKILVTMVVFILLLTTVFAQDGQNEKKQKVHLSGSVDFSTQGISPLLGSLISKNPQISADIRASYKGFGLRVYRSSDLVDSKSMANYFALAPNYYRNIAKGWSIYSAVHFELHDQGMGDFFAPYVILSKKGQIKADILLGYGHFFGEGDLTGVILALSKSYQGLNLKVSSANIYFAEKLKSSLIAEVSKEVFQKVNVGISYNYLNWNTTTPTKAGVIRIGVHF